LRASVSAIQHQGGKTGQSQQAGGGATGNTHGAGSERTRLMLRGNSTTSAIVSRRGGEGKGGASGSPEFEQQIEGPAAACVNASGAQVVEQVAVVEAGILEHVGQDGEVVEGPTVVDGAGDAQSPRGVVAEPAEIEGDWTERVAEDGTRQVALANPLGLHRLFPGELPASPGRGGRGPGVANRVEDVRGKGQPGGGGNRRLAIHPLVPGMFVVRPHPFRLLAQRERAAERSAAH